MIFGGAGNLSPGILRALYVIRAGLPSGILQKFIIKRYHCFKYLSELAVLSIAVSLETFIWFPIALRI
jgi:hypothetical protein